MELWNNNNEIQFFEDSINKFASPDKLFYKIKSDYNAYIPKGVSGENQTLQSRNSLIGQYTECWVKKLFDSFISKLGLFAVNGVICEELGITNKSKADLALCRTDSIIQKAENISILFEIKMSIVSNYKYHINDGLQYIGDYKSHKGNPSLLRSDSMLKAIGKSLNIRISGNAAKRIPIVILGNSPINESYIHKTDILKTAGVIQGFWSLNPIPTEKSYIKESFNKGFQTIHDAHDLLNKTSDVINSELNYFSSMISKQKLGEIISISNKENTLINKAEKFLQILEKL